MTPKDKSRSRASWLRQAIEIALFIFLMVLVMHITIQNFRIQGESMEPSLHNQESMLVDKISYLLHPPKRGDIIVFQYPLDPQESYVKRIIAIPGDIISIINDAVIINGVTLHEPYINKHNPFNPFPPITSRIVGTDEYFVMGDNRGDSSDSRAWGFVPRQNIIGKAVFIYWPNTANNLGILPSASAVFAKVPR